MKRHCGRPIGGGGRDMPKVDKCGQEGREGVKNGTFVRTSFMDGPISIKRKFYASCNAILSNSAGQSELARLFLLETYR